MAARTDANQKPIVAGLRAAGCWVVSLHRVGDGCPDLLVNRLCRLYLLEVKSPKARTRGKTAEKQAEFARNWPVTVVHTLDEALHAVGLLK